MFVSQLVLIPLLAIFSWMYFHFRPHGVRGGKIIIFDVAVIALALICSLAGLIWAASTELGHASAIWKPILYVITTFHIFPFVLFGGWLLRRRYFRP